MTIAFTNLGASVTTATNPDLRDNVDRTVYVNSSWTPPSADNCLILLTVFNSRGTDVGNVPTVVGNNLTWVNLLTVTRDPGAVAHRTTLFAAISTGTASTGGTTGSFGSDTQSSCEFSFCQVTGVDLSGGVTGAFVQRVSNNTGAAGVTGSVALAAFASADNRPYAAFYHQANEALVAKGTWTELDDMNNSTPNIGVMTACREDAADTNVYATWASSSIYIVVAAELKAAAAGGGGSTYEDAVTIGKILSLLDSAQLAFNPSSNLANIKGISDSMTLDAYPSASLSSTKGVSDVANIDFQIASALANIKGLSDLTNLDMHPSASLGTTKGLSDLMNLDIYPDASLSSAKGITDQAAIDMLQDLALAALKSVGDDAQMDFGPTIGFQQVAGIDPSIIGTMNLELGLGKLVSISVDGSSSTVVVVTKGYVIVFDFSTSPVTATSFKASVAGTADFASSDAGTASFKSSRADNTDFAQSGVETEDE